MTSFLHSRYSVVVMAMMVIAMVWYAAMNTPMVYPAGDMGIVAGWNTQVFHGTSANLAAGLLLTVGAAVLIVYLNRIFNLLRCITALPAAAFLLMMAATPAAAAFPAPGIVLCIVVILSLYILYSAFGDPWATRSVFIVFAMLSAGAAVSYSFAIYIPVMLLACVQLRLFSMRSILAMIMGIATPWIILLGFGIVSPDMLQWPYLRFESVPFENPGIPVLLTTVIFTVFVAALAWVQSLMRFLQYNGHSRALLSVQTVLMLVTAVAAIADFANAYAYLPMLYACTGIQLGHLFGVVHRQRKSWIAILSVFLVYILLYLWRIAVSM